MNKNLVVFGDILVFCLGVWFLSRLEGRGAGIVWALAGSVTTLPLLRGTSFQAYAMMWILRFTALGAIAGHVHNYLLLWVSSLFIAILVLALIVAWMFGPKETGAGNTKSAREQEDVSSKPTQKGAIWIALASIAGLATIGALGTMVVHLVSGNSDLNSFLWKFGAFAGCLLLVFAFLKTHAGTWRKSPFIIYDLKEAT